jgi:tetratricopeptide (TPR) repeat protein
LLGYAHANLGGHLAAESAYRMAALLDPATMDWQMGLARSFFEQRRFADAVALTEGLIAAQPERADLWLLQANAFLGLGDSARAAENFELVERLGRSSADSLNTLADIYVNQGLATLAVDAYARAMALAPEAKPTRALRAAKVLTAGGALDETRRLLAEVEARHAERLEPGEKKELLALRARLALAAGAGAEEAAALREIVALDPLDGEALILLGQYHAREGDAEQAVFYYQRAAGLAAFEADAKVRHAQLLVRAGRLAEALPLLRRAQELQPRENIQKYLEDVQRHAEVR